MKFPYRLFMLFLCATTLPVPAIQSADEVVSIPCPHCSARDGVCYREVVTHRCRLVEEKKPIKKTVYECREVPYCEQKLPRFLACEGCPECKDCVKYKKVLYKKEIVCGETSRWKCVVEQVVHKVPCCNRCQECVTELPRDEVVDASAAFIPPVITSEPVR
ncbi:MAG: hypothetical protein FJ295_01080 [Planctomycetes bacterium]|nr:hypothetical protein [Planctomycetota bacterium]